MTDAKQLRKRLRELRADWKTWRTATPTDPGFIELVLVCPVGGNRYRNGVPVVCGDPTCEGCGATLYRFDRMKETETEIRTLSERIDATAAPKPETTRKAVVFTGRGEQLVMFV